ncbi:MAG: bifunctional orotidine-5'-phosphate decarboxylase/orotate phosphoribosyltransferase [Cyanobacteria bacterium]|nr:bifunctional orotidine-5'-phosphate decarboxylase/orotate phosphoribosyltransferase [Cyanobacteriota bacterium]
MTFFLKLTEAIASRQSLLITGLDPNPEMLQSWNRNRGGGAGSFLSQSRRWIKAVIEETSDHVCAFKPSLGFYQALGAVGIDLLREVRELVPLEIPLILDAKHADLNSASALANYVFDELNVDAVSLSPLAGHDLAAPFLLHTDRAVVITCHSSSPASRILQHHPNEANPLYLRIVAESRLWATPEQLLLEVGTSDPEILARVRNLAPDHVLILRSLWGEEERLETLLQAGLGSAADGLLLPVPQNMLMEDRLGERVAELKGQIATIRDRVISSRQPAEDRCELWLPARCEQLDSLIVDLFDIGCLLFGEYVQASGALFNYYIDLRRIISNPNVFHRVLHAYSLLLADLNFDRIAGIPYGSLPTATGLSLLLHKPLIYPRKEVKAHGARRLIEGDFREGETALVVDDILITGGSVLEGIGKLESSGLRVEDVVVFIDHGGSAAQRLADAGYRCRAVLSIEQITAVLREAGRLNADQAALLGGHG